MRQPSRDYVPVTSDLSRTREARWRWTLAVALGWVSLALVAAVFAFAI